MFLNRKLCPQLAGMAVVEVGKQFWSTMNVSFVPALIEPAIASKCQLLRESDSKVSLESR